MGADSSSTAQAAASDDSAARTRLETLVPPFRRRLLGSASDESSPVARYQAVVLRSDIVGFTALTDAAVAVDAAGAERLAAAILTCLDRFAALAGQWGGQIAGFAGDAASAIWLVEEGADFSQAALCAARSALALHVESKSWQVDGTPIRLRSYIGYGSLDHFEVGDSVRGWHGVVSGQAFSDALAAGPTALPDQILMSPTAWSAVRSKARGELTSSGACALKHVLAQASKPSVADAGHELPLSVLQAAAHMPTDRIVESTSGLAGFRQVSVVFTQLRHPPYANLQDGLGLLQRAAHLAQGCVASLEGTVYQLIADENITSAIAIFGLPPLFHEDDPSRAVKAGLALHKAWSDLGVTTSTGIATGRVFLAIHESGTPRIAAIVGPPMNLAARLMQSSYGIVCDEATAIGDRHHRFDIHPIEPMRVKGKNVPVLGYVPTEIRTGPAVPPQAGKKLVGRDAEITAIEAALGRLETGQGGLCFIEAEAGLGKSSLVTHLLQRIHEREILCFMGYAEPMERERHYGVFRTIYQDLFGQTQDASCLPKGIPERLYDVLGDQAALAPLLNDVLGVELPDTAETARLTGEGRRALTQALLLEHLGKAVERQPAVVIVEDCHWTDSSSWELLTEIAEARSPILLVATSRPLETENSQYSRLLAAPGASHIVLQPLDATQAGRAVSGVLEASHAEPEIGDLILHRTGGNPLSIEELVPLLYEHGVLAITEGKVKLSLPVPAAQDQIDIILRRSGAPDTLERIVLARFDRIAASDQTFLRGASVIGTTCSIQDLMLVLDGDTSAVATAGLAVQRLVELGFLAARKDRRFEFKHALLRDIIYNAMSWTERRRLHLATARILEQNQHSLADLSDAVIGRHFALAGELDKGALHLISASEQALARFQNIEANSLAGEATQLLDRIQADSASKEHRMLRTRAELVLGNANYHLSRHQDAVQHGQAALALLGFPMPRNHLSLASATVGQLLTQALHRLFPARIPQPRESRVTSRLHSATMTLAYLMEIFLFQDRQLATVYAAVRQLNLAERGRLPARMALGYANFSALATALKRKRMAMRYRHRALSAASGIDDRHALIWVALPVAIADISAGSWTDASTRIDQAIENAAQAHDWRSWRAVMEWKAYIAGCRGEWEAAYTAVLEALPSAERDRDRRAEISLWRCCCYYSLRLERFEQASAYLTKIRNAFDAGVTAEKEITHIDLLAMSAKLSLQRGNLADAKAAAIASLSLIEDTDVRLPIYYLVILLVGEVLLDVWVATRDKVAESQLRKAAWKITKLLKRQAGIHRIAEPAYWLMLGGFKNANGNNALAEKHWRLCVDTALRMQMGYEVRHAGAAVRALRHVDS